MQKQSQSVAASHPFAPLALWWFVHPYVAAEFDQYVKDKLGRAEGLSGFCPLPEHYQGMQAFGEEHKRDGRAYVFAVPQSAGCVVFVPLGWPHTVINLQACCKVAWDYLDMRLIDTFAAAHRDVISPLFNGDIIADDYMAVRPIVSVAMEKVARQLYRS